METKRKRIKRKRKSARKAVKAGTYSITLNDFFRIDFKKRRAIRTSDGRDARWRRTRGHGGDLVLVWAGLDVPKYVKNYVRDVIFKTALVS